MDIDTLQACQLAPFSVFDTEDSEQLHCDALFRCDYDRGVHPLYNAIEKKKWEEADQIFLEESDRKGVSNEGAPPRVKVLAMTWMYRRHPDDSNRIKWCITVLHAAVIFDAPLDILAKLLNAYPEAASLQDDRGNLPLHLAYKNGLDKEKMQQLRNAYRDGEEVKNHDGLRPIECVAFCRRRSNAIATVIEEKGTVTIIEEKGEVLPEESEVNKLDNIEEKGEVLLEESEENNLDTDSHTGTNLADVSGDQCKAKPSVRNEDFYQRSTECSRTKEGKIDFSRGMYGIHSFIESAGEATNVSNASVESSKTSKVLHNSSKCSQDCEGDTKITVDVMNETGITITTCPTAERNDKFDTCQNPVKFPPECDSETKALSEKSSLDGTTSLQHYTKYSQENESEREVTAVKFSFDETQTPGGKTSDSKFPNPSPEKTALLQARMQNTEGGGNTQKATMENELANVSMDISYSGPFIDTVISAQINDDESVSTISTGIDRFQGYSSPPKVITWLKELF